MRQGVIRLAVSESTNANLWLRDIAPRQLVLAAEPVGKGAGGAAGDAAARSGIVR